MKPSVELSLFVLKALESIVPPGTKPCGSIIGGRFVSKNKAVATLMMFDGLPGTVKIAKWSGLFEDAWRVTWPDLPGGAICYANGEWSRVPPVQMTFADLEPVRGDLP